MHKQALKRILVLDDDPGVLHLMWAVLKREGHSVSTASSSHEAEERMRSEHFDFLVTDHDMPRENGLSFVRRIRNSDGGALQPHRDIPVVMVTANCDPGHVQALEQAGVLALVQKPFRPAAFLDVVRRLTRGATPGFIHLQTHTAVN